MKRKSLFWCMATLMLSIMLNPITTFADLNNDENIVETIDTNTPPTYETSNDIPNQNVTIDTSLPIEQTSTTVTITTLETIQDTTTTTTIDTTTISNIEQSETSLEYTETTTTTNLDILELTTTQETDITTINNIIIHEETSYLNDGINIVSSTKNTTPNDITTLNTTMTNNFINDITISKDTINTIHTLADTNVTKTSNSPETKPVTIIVPILLLMAGALFMSATSTPKNSKR